MPFDQTNYQAEPIGRQRLRILADFLETQVPAERFHIGAWAKSIDFEKCGTVGCAIGWATTIPEFKAAGLSLTWNHHLRSILPAYEMADDWNAVMAFFGLDLDGAAHFFGPSSYDD